MSEMDPGIVLYGFSAVVLVVFLTQTAREAGRVPGRFLPLVALVAGLLLMAVNQYLPEPHRQVVIVGLGLGAAAAMAIRHASKPVTS